MNNTTYCNGCKCTTYSIRESRAKFICDKCGHNKTLSDIFQHELHRTNQR